jgi:hypothetical protein
MTDDSTYINVAEVLSHISFPKRTNTPIDTEGTSRLFSRTFDNNVHAKITAYTTKLAGFVPSQQEPIKVLLNDIDTLIDSDPERGIFGLVVFILILIDRLAVS